MTFTKSLLALAFTGMLFVSCKDSANAPKEAAADEMTVNADAPAGKIETASFSIDGMSCAVSCAKTIESKLSKLEGVQNATVDFDKKTATVEYDAAKQTPEKLVEFVEAVAGGKTYKVSDVKSSADQAMFLGDKDKEKKKKKAKKGAAAETPATEEKPTAKPACCASKKSCSAEKAAL